MPVLYSSLSGSSSDTSTRVSQPFSLRLSSSFRKSSLRFWWPSRRSFFISNMIGRSRCPPRPRRKDEVALAAAAASLSFSKYARGNARGANAVELRLAVLLQRLAHHLGGQARLHVPQARNLAIAVAQLQAYCSLMALPRLLFTTTRFRSFFSSSRSFDHRHRLGHRQPGRHLGRLQL